VAAREECDRYVEDYGWRAMTRLSSSTLRTLHERFVAGQVDSGWPFYARGLIHPTVESASLDDINEVFGRMERGQIDGRVVIDYR
jgi:hypothetical protein